MIIQKKLIKFYVLGFWATVCVSLYVSHALVDGDTLVGGLLLLIGLFFQLGFSLNYVSFVENSLMAEKETAVKFHGAEEKQ